MKLRGESTVVIDGIGQGIGACVPIGAADLADAGCDSYPQLARRRVRREVCGGHWLLLQQYVAAMAMEFFCWLPSFSYVYTKPKSAK